MDSVPDSVVGFLLGSLKDIIVHYSDLISGTPERVNDLCNQLDTLKGFIKKCEKKNKREEDEFVLGLMKEVRRVVFTAEDAIETYIVTSVRQNDKGFISKALHFAGFVSDLQGVADQIQSVSTEVEKFYQNKAKHCLDIIHNDDIHKKDLQPRNKKALLTEEKSIMVGFEKEMEKVINLLEKDSEELEVISIVGMPGLGKTRLAMEVKNHPQIIARFPTIAFINVSKEFNAKEVFLNILAAVDPNHKEMKDKSDEDIATAICKVLEKTKYMIVMDDVWTIEAWERLKCAFPCNEDSKVLITSRNDNVACYANRSVEPLHLRLLEEVESRELLSRQVFGEERPPKVLERYIKEIASKCGGLPLSILVIAGIFSDSSDRRSPAHWKRVADRVNVFIARREKQDRGIALSYETLPHHLQLCFLYLGVFHEDSIIPVWKLLRLWIAEGFVEQEEDSRLEDTAKDYLEQLVIRNLVIVVEKKANGEIKTCRLHNIVRDFCKKAAKEQNLFREIKMRGEGASPSRASDYYRRLCINSYVEEYNFTHTSNNHVRSLLSFSKEEVTQIPEELVSSFPKGFKLLRVLDARSIVFPYFPDELLCLVLLRYIGISCDSTSVPEKISNLRSLQTLIIIITKSKGPLEVKADIWKMAELRHLHTNVSIRLPPKGKYDERFMKSRNLQTVSRISPESCRIDVLEKTPNIKKLGICGKLEPSLFDGLSSLQLLEDLKLFNEESQMSVLPASTKFPKTLTKLTLQNTLLDWKYMSVLAKLPYLEVLKLKDNAFVGGQWGPMEETFECLVVLHIVRTNLVEWNATKDNFPELRDLILKECRVLMEIPSGIGLIDSLQTIELSNTNRGVAISASRIEELKINMSQPFRLIAPLEHLVGELTSDEGQPNMEMTVGNQASFRRAEASPEIKVSVNMNSENMTLPSCLPFYKRIFQKLRKGSNGKTSKTKKNGTEGHLSTLKH